DATTSDRVDEVGAPGDGIEVRRRRLTRDQLADVVEQAVHVVGQLAGAHARARIGVTSRVNSRAKKTAPASSASGSRNASGYWNERDSATGCVCRTCGCWLGATTGATTAGAAAAGAGRGGAGAAGAAGMTGGAIDVTDSLAGLTRTVIDEEMCREPVRLRPLNATCHASVGCSAFASGTSALPSCGNPCDHASTKVCRSRVNVL